jgi:hypothetical protein
MGSWAYHQQSVPLSHADVVLPDKLHQRMVAEQRSGELELGVEMRRCFPKDSSLRTALSAITSQQVAAVLPDVQCQIGAGLRAVPTHPLDLISLYFFLF